MCGLDEVLLRITHKRKCAHSGSETELQPRECSLASGHVHIQNVQSLSAGCPYWCRLLTYPQTRPVTKSPSFLCLMFFYMKQDAAGEFNIWRQLTWILMRVLTKTHSADSCLQQNARVMICVWKIKTKILDTMIQWRDTDHRPPAGFQRHQKLRSSRVTSVILLSVERSCSLFAVHCTRCISLTNQFRNRVCVCVWDLVLP